MPQMGLEVAEGTVAAIHVAVGDQVAEGDPLLELETDKALTDVVAPRSGNVVVIEVEVGDTVAIGQTLIVLASGDEERKGGPSPVEVTPSSAAPAGSGGERRGAAPTSRRAAVGERLRAAPIARRAAERWGIPLEEVVGTGPRGRVTLRDVEAASARAARGGAGAAKRDSTAPPAEEELEELGATRRTVARRMTLSQKIPQFPLTRQIDATWLLDEKERLSTRAAKLSVNDLLIQSLAETALRHRDLAASYVERDDGGPAQLRRRSDIDVGLAVATDRGLVVPVLRRARERSLGELAAHRLRLVDAARSGKLRQEEMGGATITLSSLAGFGVDSFAAMLNPGETAILAVGRVVERVVPCDRGLAVIPTLTLTLTIDHRAMDGASGAQALSSLAELLEGGMAWRS